MPKVSVVILNWNGKNFVEACLRSFEKVTYTPLEIIVIDNNSSDGSPELIAKLFPKVRLITSPKNYGFAQGNNIGWKAASGDYILFLNNDTSVTPNFIQILLDVCQKDRSVGCVQPEMRVLNCKQCLDEAGAYLTFTGFLYHYGYRKDYKLPIYRSKRDIFSAKGACMLIRKDVLEYVGGFDDDFFIFFEETDLCHRIWLSGYKVVYEPKASIFHVAGGDTTTTYNRDRRIYLTFKNMNHSYLINFGFLNLVTVYPVFVVAQFLLLCFFSLSGKFSLVRAMLAAYWWNLSHFSTMLRKRKRVQCVLRKISDWQLNKNIMFNPGWYYYFCLLFNAQQYKDISLK